MGECILYGNGGSNPLNFKVICNPQPNTAKENTIWVDTDKINKYYFSANQPENMVEYDVWFPTGTTSVVYFNALKKNAIEVYPDSAKQYVGGVLIDVTAKIYQYGAWVELWGGQLYESGNQFPFYTGGWNSNGNGTMTFEADSMVIGPPSSQKNIRAVTADKFDLTKYNKLCMEFTSSSDSGYPRFGAADIQEPSDSGGWIAYVQVGKVDSYERAEVDVSELSGSYYIVIARWGTGKTTVRKVWVE